MGVKLCAYCKREGEEWISGKVYNGLDEHHNPPKFLFKDNLEWKGKTYLLCREHHVWLHRKIKLILNRVAGTTKFVNSEEWICNKMTLIQIAIARKEVYDFTEEWINNGATD